MIYSRFGSRVTLVSKHEDVGGRLSLQGVAEGSELVREYGIGDLTADGGMVEIREAAAELPWKAVGKRATRGVRRLL